MKRLSSSDSLGALMSICPTSGENSPRNKHVYGRDEFQSMIGGFEEDDESGHVSEKKRRLSLEQVKALEKNFEVENKLEPERKLKLARELGLQPRQVAVWFQNRRARWKTKQLERDYGVLKANYESLKLTHNSLQLDNEALLKEIRELKVKLEEDNTDQSNLSVEEEIVLPADSQNVLIEQTKLEIDHIPLPPESKDFKNNDGDGGRIMEAELFPDFKDGSSDSDSSAILNEDYSPTAAISSTVELKNHHHHHHQHGHLVTESSPSLNYLHFQKPYQPQVYPKMEEHNFFSGEEACNFFSDEQAPTLHWWN